jgi:hypothetical protein
MSTYIVCHKKRNNPRMNVRICEKKCDLRNECQEYLSYRRADDRKKNDILLTSESQPLPLSEIQSSV